MTLGLPSRLIDTGAPAKSAPSTVGMVWPMAGSPALWVNNGSGVPLMTGAPDGRAPDGAVDALGAPDPAGVDAEAIGVDAASDATGVEAASEATGADAASEAAGVEAGAEATGVEAADGDAEADPSPPPPVRAMAAMAASTTTTTTAIGRASRETVEGSGAPAPPGGGVEGLVMGSSGQGRRPSP